MGNVFEVVGSRFLRLEGEGGVEDDTQVADLRDWSDGTAINGNEKISNLPEQWLGGHNHELSLIAIKFE